jgi:hypothetical protein
MLLTIQAKSIAITSNRILFLSEWNNGRCCSVLHSRYNETFTERDDNETVDFDDDNERHWLIEKDVLLRKTRVKTCVTHFIVMNGKREKDNWYPSLEANIMTWETCHDTHATQQKMDITLGFEIDRHTLTMTNRDKIRRNVRHFWLNKINSVGPERLSFNIVFFNNKKEEERDMTFIRPQCSLLIYSGRHLLKLSINDSNDASSLFSRPIDG